MFNENDSKINDQNKKIKLSLDEFKVQSFVTALGDEEKDSLKGGKLPLPTWPKWLCD